MTDTLEHLLASLSENYSWRTMWAYHEPKTLVEEAGRHVGLAVKLALA